MATINLFMEGFEQYSRTMGASQTLALMRLNDWTTLGSAASITLAEGRSSDEWVGGENKCVVMTLASLVRDYVWTTDILSVGVAIKFEGEGGGLFRIRTPAGDIDLRRSVEDGQLYCLGAAGSAIPVEGNWYFIEFVIDRTTQNLKVYINSKLDIDQPIGFSLAAVQLVTIQLCPYDINPLDGTSGNTTPATSTTIAINYDHLYINSDTKLGTLAVRTRFPTESLVDEWGNSTVFEAGENLPNWTIAASLPEHDPLKRYLFASEVGKQELYFSSDNVSSRPVIAASVTALLRKTASIPIAATLTFDQQTADVDAIYSTYKFYSRAVDIAGYNKAMIENSQFGIKVK